MIVYIGAKVRGLYEIRAFPSRSLDEAIARFMRKFQVDVIEDMDLQVYSNIKHFTESQQPPDQLSG